MPIGCGNQPTGLLGSVGGSPLRSGLTRGIYVGILTSEVDLAASQQGDFFEKDEFSWVVEISENGIPIIDGIEVSRGDFFTVEGLGLYSEQTVTSVSSSNDGIVIRYDVDAILDTGDTIVDLAGAQLETYRIIGARQLNLTRTFSLTGFANGEFITMNLDAYGVLSRQ